MYLRPYTVAMLICIQWHIYLQWYVANVEVGTQQATGADCRDHNTPAQRALSHQIVWQVMQKKLILRPLIAGILTFKKE